MFKTNLDHLIILMFYIFIVSDKGVKVGYMRVSTADGSQKFDMQETALLNAGVSPEKI